jgi:hypothetical protein
MTRAFSVNWPFNAVFCQASVGVINSDGVVGTHNGIDQCERTKGSLLHRASIVRHVCENPHGKVVLRRPLMLCRLHEQKCEEIA